MNQAKTNTAAPLSEALLRLISEKNAKSLTSSSDPLTSLGGSLAFHCSADLDKRKITETASMATLYRGYESLLPGRDLNKVGLVSSTASGICGGVHATASALCLEMALGMSPPPLGIIIRNLLLSCQYLNDNTMHLFVLAGPDYSQKCIESTNPEVWQKALYAPCEHKQKHGYQRISDILTDLNKPTGKLYKQALSMVGAARQAYIILGGKYPHSESIIPGGVSVSLDQDKIRHFCEKIAPFLKYTEQSTAIWDDVFQFMLDANPAYEDLGRTKASMLDFGQWDNEEYYDGKYQNCDTWGEKRWSTPGVLINGELRSTKLSELNAGMEEFVDHSYFGNWVDQSEQHFLIKEDPLGNPLKPNHPWNKRVITRRDNDSDSTQAYSWGSCLTWNRHSFEVGAYARLYLTARAQKIAPSPYLSATGNSLDFQLPQEATSNSVDLSWAIPETWNTFERNRARAYVLAFNLAAIYENIDRASKLIKSGNTEISVPMPAIKSGQQLGVGLWGASRGFLAHWARLDDGKIDNYQISIPSRVNASTRTPWGDLGPCEQAVLNSPILETNFSGEHDFKGIDIQRAIQSFDPCMSCTTHIHLPKTGTVLDSIVDTGFPI
ncbi:MAG: nickel-dependent hydrogenase large subunit [Arenicella sp.]|nr:nickel-dependent hydrogenase large subunit [Arenicella sp.]